MLADIASDGELKILLALDRHAPELDRAQIKTLTADGSEIFRYEAGIGKEHISAPAVGDIDGDKRPEVMALTWGEVGDPIHLTAWSWDAVPLWSVESYSSAWWVDTNPPAPPVLADLDGDGSMEILVSLSYDQTKLFDYEGRLIRQWEMPLGKNRLSVGQWRATAAPDDWVAVQSSSMSSEPRRGVVLASDPGTGSPKTGWTEAGVAFSESPVTTQPLIADLRGDPDQEVGLGNRQNGMGEAAEIHFQIADPAGTLVSDGGLWPLRFTGDLFSTPLVEDLDGDGDLDLAISTGPPAAPAGSPPAIGDPFLYLFDLDSGGPGSVSWGEYAHDAYNSSQYHNRFRIAFPNHDRPLTVGPHDRPWDQVELLVHLRFARSIPPAAPSAWQVTIGDRAASVNRLTRVGSDLWLHVDPVSQLAPGHYGITVTFNDGGIRSWHSQPEAVGYGNLGLTATSHLLLIDRSKSESNYLSSITRAAQSFINSLADEDELGIMAFAPTTTTAHPLSSVSLDRAAMLAALSGISTVESGTSVAEAISAGMDHLSRHASPFHHWIITLVTDGMENTAPLWEEGAVHRGIFILKESHPAFSINVIAAGYSMNTTLLREIASSSGGSFFQAGASPAAAYENKLADAFHQSWEEIQELSRKSTDINSLAPGVLVDIPIAVTSDHPRSQWLIHLAYADPRAVLRGFTRPDGTPLLAGDPDLLSFYFSEGGLVLNLVRPQMGIWTVTMRNPLGRDEEAMIIVCGD